MHSMASPGTIPASARNLGPRRSKSCTSAYKNRTPAPKTSLSTTNINTDLTSETPNAKTSAMGGFDGGSLSTQSDQERLPATFQDLFTHLISASIVSIVLISESCGIANGERSNF